MTAANTCRDMHGPRANPGPRVRRCRHRQTVTTQAGNLPNHRRNGQPRPRCQGLPRPTGDAHGGRLVFKREKTRHGPGHALDGASSRGAARSISGKRPKSTPGATLSATASSSQCKDSALQSERKADLAFGSGRRGYVPRPFPKTLLVSRSHKGRNDTHRPLRSLGCARLKPNPVGQQRLRSTIFPFSPPKDLKAKKRF
jgi:hypothetical protein